MAWNDFSIQQWLAFLPIIIGDKCVQITNSKLEYLLGFFFSSSSSTSSISSASASLSLSLSGKKISHAHAHDFRAAVRRFLKVERIKFDKKKIYIEGINPHETEQKITNDKRLEKKNVLRLIAV